MAQLMVCAFIRFLPIDLIAVADSDFEFFVQIFFLM